MWDFFHDQVARCIYAFHADIHPGNFLFRDDGRLGILDYGCVKEFPRDFLDTCIRMLAAHIEDDAAALHACYLQTGTLDPRRRQAQAGLYNFLRAFGRFVLKPYCGDDFDFGDPGFRRELNDYIRALLRWRDIRVSPHFIFVNRLLLGLYAMLVQLKPRVVTRRSRHLLLEEAARHAA